MSSIRKFDPDDILAWGMLSMMVSKSVPPGDCVIYKDEYGYYTDYIDVKVNDRWLRLTASTERDKPEQDVDYAADLADLLEELGDDSDCP